MIVWLQADQGVELKSSGGQEVASWTSSVLNSNGKATRFETLTPVQHKMAQRTWKKTLTADANVAKQEGRRTVPKSKTCPLYIHRRAT